LDKDTYTKIYNFTSLHGQLGNLGVDFFIKNEAHVQVNEFMEYCNHTTGNYYYHKCDVFNKLYPDSFYNKILCAVPVEKRFNLTNEVTYNFITRMNVKEQETFAKDFSTSDKIPLDNLSELLKDVSYKVLQEAFHNKIEKAQYFISEIIKNKDKENAQKVILEHNQPEEKVYPLFSLFNYEEKLKIFDQFKKGTNYWQSYPYEKHLDKILTERLMLLLKKVLSEDGQIITW
jgi:hypothetical protein